MAKHESGMKEVGLILLGVAIFVIAIYFRCFSGQDSAKTFLEGHGYTQVAVSAGGLFSCSENERATSFTARDPGNKAVSGSVCNSLFLNPSIRLD